MLHWLRANKIHLNVAKTEVILFKQRQKIVNYNIKIKLDGKLMRFSSQTKYLGMLIDENLTMEKQKGAVSSKLGKANGALSLIRHFVPLSVLRCVYYALFQPHIQYGLQIWGQDITSNSRIARLQKIAVRIMTFAEYNAPSSPLFKRINIMPISDCIFLLNALTAYDNLNRLSPIAVQQILNLEYLSNQYRTRGVQNNLLKRPFARTTKYGINSIKYQTVLNWNDLQISFEKTDLTSVRRTKFKAMIKEFLKQK